MQLLAWAKRQVTRYRYRYRRLGHSLYGQPDTSVKVKDDENMPSSNRDYVPTNGIICI
jgi:hypothetical protein